MKMKRLLAFLMSGLVMLSCTACSEDDNTRKDSKPDATISETDTSDKQDSDSTEDSDSETITDIITAPFDNANANCEVIFSAAKALGEKCQSAGILLTQTDGDCTGILVINSATEESVSIKNIEGASSANPTLSESAITEISKAVNNGLSYSEVNIIGTVYCIFYNGRGLPTAVFWAEDETSEIVGKYPSEDTYAYTEGGINSIVQNGPEAFGNISLG